MTRNPLYVNIEIHFRAFLICQIGNDINHLDCVYMCTKALEVHGRETSKAEFATPPSLDLALINAAPLACIVETNIT